jgi:hypothetical protein
MKTSQSMRAGSLPALQRSLAPRQAVRDDELSDMIALSEQLIAKPRGWVLACWTVTAGFPRRWVSLIGAPHGRWILMHRLRDVRSGRGGGVQPARSDFPGGGPLSVSDPSRSRSFALHSPSVGLTGRILARGCHSVMH